MKPSNRIYEVWEGGSVVCSAQMGLNKASAQGKVDNEKNRGIFMRIEPAPAAVIELSERKLLCTVCGSSTKDGKSKSNSQRRFRERHPKLCAERADFARQVSAGTRCVDEEERGKR